MAYKFRDVSLDEIRNVAALILQRMHLPLPCDQCAAARHPICNTCVEKKDVCSKAIEEIYEANGIIERKDMP